MLTRCTTSFLQAARNTVRLLTLPLFLAGCATVAPPVDTTIPATAQERAYHDAIDLGGRLSVRYQQNGNDHAVHGSFTWAQSPGRTLVTLLSPLGQTMATIEITPGMAVLTQAGQPPRMAADVDALAASALGWPLPISGLRDWLQGFAVDAGGRRIVAMPRDKAQSATTRDGWHINYESWKNGTDLSAQNHPRRIDLARSTAQAGDVALRIVIDNWQPR